MTAAGRRRAASTGLVVAGAVALWWLGSARLALERGDDAGRSAADALHALGLVRALLVALLGPRLGAVAGWRDGARGALLLVAPAWPVVALAWSASVLPAWHAVAVELALLALAALLPALGPGLRRWLASTDRAELAATTAGAALAALAWLARGLLAAPQG